MITSCGASLNIVIFEDMETKYQNMSLEEMSKDIHNEEPGNMDFCTAFAEKLAKKMASSPEGETLRITIAEIASYEQRYGISSKEYSKALRDGRLAHNEDTSNWGFSIQRKKRLEQHQSPTS